MIARIHKILIFLSLISSIEMAPAGNLRGEVESLIQRAGVKIKDEEIEICASRISRNECHAQTDDSRCVYCPTYSLKSSLVDVEGICLPATIFALACPKTSRSLL